MQHNLAPELDAEKIEAAAARVAAMNLSDPKPFNEKLAEKYIAESGKTVHASDCSTSVAPAEVPGPCDCDVQPTPTHDKPGAPSMQAINSILGRERKPRSDKGVQRTPKVQTLSIEAVSAMTPEQAQELIRLVAARNETLKIWEDAQMEAEKCEADFKMQAQALQKFIEALAVTK